MKRSQVFYLSMTATAAQQVFTPIFNDKNKNQVITGVHVGLTTSGISVALIYDGRTIASVDCTYFSAGNGVLEVDVTVPPQQQLQIALTDIAAGAHNNVPVLIEYQTTE